MFIQIELTDTFDGEANYSWVRRYQIPVIPGESERAIIRRAKRAAGLTGRHKKASHGDMIALYFPECLVLFITREWEA